MYQREGPEGPVLLFEDGEKDLSNCQQKLVNTNETCYLSIFGHSRLHGRVFSNMSPFSDDVKR